MNKHILLLIVVLVAHINLNAIVGKEGRGDNIRGLPIKTDSHITTLTTPTGNNLAKNNILEQIYNYFEGLNNANGLHIYCKSGLQQKGEVLGQFDNVKTTKQAGAGLAGGPSPMCTITYEGSNKQQALRDIEDYFTIGDTIANGIKLNYEHDRGLPANAESIGWFYNPVNEASKIDIYIIPTKQLSK